MAGQGKDALQAALNIEMVIGKMGIGIEHEEEAASNDAVVFDEDASSWEEEALKAAVEVDMVFDCAKV